MVLSARYLIGCTILFLSIFGSPSAHAQAVTLEERLAALEAAKAEADAAKAKDASSALKVTWKDGVYFETADKQFKAKIGGRIHNDWGWIPEDNDPEDRQDQFDSVGDLEDGVIFRRARLYMTGTMYDRIEFKAQYDFAGGTPKFRDVWFGVLNVPVVQNWRVGQMQEMFGLEVPTSSNYITFIERSVTSNFAGLTDRNTGMMIYGNFFEDMLYYATGVFRDTDDFGNRIGEGEYAWTSRLAASPIYQDNMVLHVGVDYKLQDPNDDTVRFRTRPEHSIAPNFIDTRDFAADDVNLVGFEAALVWGPFSIQSEYVLANVDREEDDDPTVMDESEDDANFHSTYVQLSWFITGERRTYDRKNAIFGRVRPKQNMWSKDNGWGAWEVATRYSLADFQDKDIDGGTTNNFTLGLNWYWNPSTRVMFNYIYSNLDPRTGGIDDVDVNMFLTRFAIDW